jgi:replication factor C large subunit
MAVPWIIKYKPKSLSDVAGNSEAIESLINWVKSWDKKVPAKKALLLYGPPGTGKTVSVEALAKDFKFDLIEINASDKRTGDALRRVAGMAATQAGLFGRKRLILIDEIDGINLSEDVGAVSAVIDVINAARCPIIFTANNAWDPKISPLRDHCLLVQFKRLGIRDSLRYLKGICAMEGIEVDEKALRLIIERNEGDMRSIMNDLQALSTGKKMLTYDEVSWLAWRDRKETIFDALRTVFSAKSCSLAKKALDLADVDHDMLFEWIYENAPHQLTDPRDLANAMEALAKADLYLRRVKKTQAWDLLSFALDLMTAGVAMSRERTRPQFIQMKFPERIRLLSKTKKIRELQMSIGAKVGRKCHVSASAGAKYFLPYLHFIFRNNPEMAAGLAKWFDFSEEMINFLTEKKI